MIMGSRASSCSTLARADRILVPRPAARVIAASGAGSRPCPTCSVILTVIRYLPSAGFLARRDHPLLFEGASIGDIDCRQEQVHDPIIAVALVLELVVDQRFAGFVVNCLSQGQRLLLMELVQCKTRAPSLGAFEVNRDVMGLDKPIHDCPR